MSLKNLLDLRKKVSPQVQIIEKIIFQKRSWKKEALRTLAVIFIASGVIWGISKADNIVSSSTQETVAKNFSAIGIVSNIGTTTLSLQDAHGSNDKTQTAYTFELNTVSKVETKSYVPLTLSDINVGDRIVVQGVEAEGLISIKRIISFRTTAPKEIATSTPEVIVATTTEATTSDITASTTDATTTATSTLGDKIGNFVNNIVNAFTGTTSTTTDTVASTTTDDATTSVQTSTTTDATSSPTIVETIINAVKDTVSNVVNAVTGSTSTPDTTTPPTPDTPAPTGDAPPVTSTTN